MTEASHELVRRVAAAQATLEEFKGKPFTWGKRDCSRLVAAHLRRMGHQIRLPPEGAYRTAGGALRTMRELGYEAIGEALDAIGLERIAPAAALVGDVVQGASGDVFGALGVLLGNGRLIGYHEHAVGAAVLQQIDMTTAWRVVPR